MGIVSTPDVCKGKPRIDNTRIAVEKIMGHVARGRGDVWFSQKYPQIPEPEIRNAITYGKLYTISSASPTAK